MLELSYSFHLGNDKNKTTKAKQVSKDKPTNFNNNAIQNSIQLSKVNNHNLRMYENNNELISIIKGTNNIVDDVKKLYLTEFEESRINYNNKQTRNDRKINNYFNHISKDTKHDLACEIIIELGNMEYWENKNLEFKYKMKTVYEKQIINLEKIIPNFKIANATIHFDESSPHLHIVGIAIKENCKTGMNKQVGKTSVFTIESLKTIQNKLREYCINDFNNIYGLNAVLKDKEQGRNQDYRKEQMKNYNELVNNFNKQRKQINKVNEISNSLNIQSDKIKKIILNLKTTSFSKNKYVISNEDKLMFLNYINQVKDNTKNIKNITNYSLSINKIKEDFKNNYSTIDNLSSTINIQNQKIKNLKNDILNKDIIINEKSNIIDNLQNKIYKLNLEIQEWKTKFNKVINFFKNKVLGIFSNKDKDTYKNIIDDMLINNILNEKDYNKVIGKKEKNNNFER